MDWAGIKIYVVNALEIELEVEVEIRMKYYYINPDIVLISSYKKECIRNWD